MTTLNIIFKPSWHINQRRIYDGRERFNVIACGRRFGKTRMASDLLAEVALDQQPAAYFSPTYKMLSEVWRDTVNFLSQQPGLIIRLSVQEKHIALVTGGTIDMWSLDKPDTARGRKYARVVIDEAAMVPNLLDAWQAVIRPTLVDLAGDAWFFSTPRGRNGFWQLYQLASSRDEWHSQSMTSYDNPHLDPAEINTMADSMPELIRLQEVEAQFVENNAGVFRGVHAAATAEQQKHIDGHQYVFGCDWAQSHDFTVITVIDVTTQQMVYMDRFNQVDYAIQVGRLKALYDRYQPTSIIAERNSIGQPIIEQLYALNLPVVPFTTTNATKDAIIRDLALALERQELAILNDPILINELIAFESKRTATGLMTYSAPSGLHDDCVMSLALCYNGAKTSNRDLVWT